MPQWAGPGNEDSREKKHGKRKRGEGKDKEGGDVGTVHSICMKSWIQYPLLQSANQLIKEAYELLLIHPCLPYYFYFQSTKSAILKEEQPSKQCRSFFSKQTLSPSPHSLFFHFFCSWINPCQGQWKFGVWVPGWSEVTGKGRKTSICIPQSLPHSITEKAFHNL